MRIALVNPPAPFPVFRDGYCSTSTKSGYLWHPLDLLVQSGILTGMGHQVALIDAIASRLDAPKTLDRLAAFNPDAVLGLAGDVSWPGDVRFYRRLSWRLPAARLALSGDVPRFEPERAFGELPGLEAIVTDFATPGLSNFLTDDGPAEAITTRTGTTPAQSRTWSSPPARHDLLPRDAYRLPFHGGLPFASVLSSYGCPFSCTFCNTGELGFKTRPVAEVLAELRLVTRLGYRRVYLRDATANGKRLHFLELCDRWAAEDLNLAWNVFCTFQPFDPELATAMARAGCRVVQFGIETGDDALRAESGKAFKNSAAEAAVRYAHEAGLQVCGHFVLGLPGQDEASLRRTAAFARDLDLDFASFNAAAARPGTMLRREADERGLFGGDASETGFAAGLASVTPERLRAIKREAVARFYLRPRPIRAVFPDLRRREGWSHLASMAGALARTW